MSVAGAWLNGVHRTYAETAAFHVAPAMQQPKSATSTSLPWILIIHATKGYSHSLIRNHMRHVLSESAEEQRIALYKSGE